ncbi:unnamed protein product [Spirodela intermedia]|uniref:Uncharacterized protein n=1 Tax=Spirodela intermedia TaxID=51605 RepID=A0ABN7EA05_SPIIN|nr:unnamed protein product [Spirodela intermedia]
MGRTQNGGDKWMGRTQNGGDGADGEDVGRPQWGRQ